MKDILQDIVSHTQNLGFLTTVKVTGTEDKTQIFSMADDRSVIMEAETANPYPDMLGTFGMPQLNKLKYLLDGAEYKDDAKINITTAERNGETIPVGIHFENKDGDFKNDYRFMNQEIINEKMKTVKFRGVKWDVDIEPTVASVQRFNFQAGANNEHPTFLAKTDSGNLKFIFGDASTHGGEFVFAQNVAGKLDRGWTWPVLPILSILKIADVNNTKMSLSNEGAIQITLDSGLATYKYIIPAQAALMIKDIHASGRYVQVISSDANTYINGYSGLQGVGNMRYNTTSQNMEVFDGNNWVQLNMGYAAVGLNSEAESLLDWARQKRDEEMAYQELAEKNQAVKIALEKLEQAKQQLNITAKLAREYEQTTS